MGGEDPAEFQARSSGLTPLIHPSQPGVSNGLVDHNGPNLLKIHSSSAGVIFSH